MQVCKTKAEKEVWSPFWWNKGLFATTEHSLFLNITPFPNMFLTKHFSREQWVLARIGLYYPSQTKTTMDYMQRKCTSLLANAAGLQEIWNWYKKKLWKNWEMRINYSGRTTDYFAHFEDSGNGLELGLHLKYIYLITTTWVFSSIPLLTWFGLQREWSFYWIHHQ